MPLITGGALHNILKRFGIRLPVSVSRVMGGLASQRNVYEGYGGGRRENPGDLGGGTLQSIMKIAQMLI